MEEEHPKGPSHNNPEEAANYVKAVNLLLQSFVNDISGFDRYKHLDAWETFLHTYPSFSPNWTAHISSKWTHKLYSTQYQTNPVPLFLHTLKKQQTRVQQRVSSDSIPTGPEVTSKMHLQENIPSFN